MLVAVALHDREELVKPCLDSLIEKAGMPFRLAICADDPEFDPIPYRDIYGPDFFDWNTEPGSPAIARNTSLRHREPGEDFVSVDSDLVFMTEDWLATLKRTLDKGDYATVAACIGDPGPPWFHRVEPNTGVVVMRSLPVGCRLHAGWVMDRLGAFRSYGPYGMEDVDLDARIYHMGFTEAYDSSVMVKHPGIPADDAWKQEQLKRTIPLRQRWEEALYSQGLGFYQPLDEPFDPLVLREYQAP